jgi:hypothetical protein
VKIILLFVKEDTSKGGVLLLAPKRDSSAWWLFSFFYIKRKKKALALTVFNPLERRCNRQITFHAATNCHAMIGSFKMGKEEDIVGRRSE